MTNIVREDAKQTRLADLIALIDDLIAATAEENKVLARGLPATRPMQLMRKSELAKQFEAWVADVKSNQIEFNGLAEPALALINQRTGMLQEAINENIVMLRAAIATSQRRIDAVMDAIRSSVAAESGPYNTGGKIRTLPMSCSPSIQA